jgi:hypothetical protein
MLGLLPLVLTFGGIGRGWGTFKLASERLTWEKIIRFTIFELGNNLLTMVILTPKLIVSSLLVRL